MRQIKREGNTWRDVGAEPLVRDPGMRPDSEAALDEFSMQVVETLLEPCTRNADLKVLEAKLQEVLVGQGGPGKIVGTLACHARRGPRDVDYLDRYRNQDLDRYRNQDKAESKSRARPAVTAPNPGYRVGFRGTLSGSGRYLLNRQRISSMRRKPREPSVTTAAVLSALAGILAVGVITLV